MRSLIAGNWKENCTIREGMALASSIKALLKGVKDTDILVCPPFTALRDVENAIRGSSIKLGAQNVFYEDSGAFTGEISPLMLKEIGCSHVIIGHSERREYFMETDFAINKKIKACLKNGLVPIVCVGETQQEKAEGITKKIIERQITDGFAEISVGQIANVVIAYEPVWAIGTGQTATPEEAQNIHAFIRQILHRMYREKAGSVRILYGGSVKPDNILSLMAKKDINGALVGGASLNAESFAEIVKGACR